MALSFRRVATSVALVAITTSALVAAAPSATADGASAVAWLKTQQQPNGGFEVAQFPGFETADVVAALAGEAQANASWSTDEALDAVFDTQTAGHENALDALDDDADAGIGAGQAAKLIVLVTNPLGLDPNLFDPECDGGSGQDLEAILGVPGTNGTYGISTAAINQIFFAARATKALGGTVAAATIQVIRDAQRPDGSYAFNGNPVDDPDDPFDSSDVDTTAAAVMALRAGGVAADDADLAPAVAWLLGQRNGTTGAFPAFGSDDPNATAVALLALHSVDPTTYASQISAGQAYLLSQQQGDGRIASPNDGFGVNTFATAQSVQALELPTVPAGGTGGLAGCLDGNDDGVRDDDQPDVDTVPSLDGAGYVTVAASGGTLADVAAVDPATVAEPPVGVTLPSGLVSFRLEGLASGATVTVTITFHSGSSATSYFKLLADGSWVDFTNRASFSGNTVTLTLTDGGPGDDGPADGVIVDPGGPAAVAAQAAPAVPGQVDPSTLSFTG